MPSVVKKEGKSKLEPGSEDYKACETVLQELMDKPESEPFNVPVDWKGLGLPDYPKIIKKPMDLGTIKSNLDSGKYTNLAAFATDVRQVWKNAMTYNQPASAIYVVADELSQLFEKKMEKYAKKMPPKPTSGVKRKRDSKASSAKSVSYNDKLKFSNLVNQLSAVQLGKVVEMIQTRCPQALNEEDEVDIEIEVDAIDRATLLALNAYAESCISGEPASKKKK